MTVELRCACGARVSLQTLALEPGLPAQQCPACGTLVLGLDDYRRWQGAQPSIPAPAPEAIPCLTANPCNGATSKPRSHEHTRI